MENFENSPDPKSVQKLLQHSTALASIVQKVQALTHIEQKLRDILPEQLIADCHVLNLREDCLIISVHNGSLATSLRYQVKNMINQLNCPEVRTIRYVVRPESS